MRLFVSTTFIEDNSKLKSALDKCRNMKIKSIEIGSNHIYEKDYDYILDYEFEIIVHNYFPVPKDSFVINISSTDEDIRKKSIEKVKSSIKFCKDIGSQLYTFHPGFLTDPIGSNKNKNNYDFQWNDSHLNNSNYITSENLMYESLDEIINFSKKCRVNVSVETEGSLHKKNHLLMQTPQEYEKLMKRYKSSDLGINLNIGHLNLASKAFCFSKFEFVDLIKSHIVAMELSHNNGNEDQHLPLKEDGWYWPIITSKKFDKIPKILEFRNSSKEDILKSISLSRRMHHEISAPSENHI